MLALNFQLDSVNTCSYDYSHIYQTFASDDNLTTTSNENLDVRNLKWSCQKKKIFLDNDYEHNSKRPKI